MQGRILAACVLVCGAAGQSSAQSTDRLNLLVPAYFYPSGTGQTYWNQLTAAAPTVSVTAVMNPGNGPGTASDANYVAAVNALRSAGGSVSGYVYTGYGSRAIADVKADVSRYATLNYNVNGIFVDEMANTPTTANLAYYRELYQHVKTVNPTWRVFGNPGTTTDEAFLTGASGRTADTVVVFENTRAAYTGYAPSSWNATRPRNDLAHLVHTTADAAAMSSAIDLAVARNAGYVYVTDDVLTNPWDTLPSYWTNELNKIQITPVPEPVGMLAAVAGVAAVGLWRRRK